MKLSNIKVLLFALVVIVFSCHTTKELSQPAITKSSYETLSQSLLWKISGKDLGSDSYLYGTIHMINSEDFFWPKGTLSAIDQTNQMAFEVDLDDMFDFSTQMSLFTKALMNDNVSLRDLLTEDEYLAVSEHFSGMGLPMFMLERIKPMFLTVFASGDIEMGGLQNGEVKSYEMELYEMAKQSEKEVHGLETIEYQISIFDSIPYQEQAKMLLESIEGSDTEDDQFKQMIEMYREQDIDRMVDMMKEEEMGVEEYEDILLHQRNIDWIPKMQKLMTENATFFAVGAGHLAGERGVINLLKKEGYELIPLSASN